MRLLCTADLHAPPPGAYAHLADLATSLACPVVALAGDLLNGFARDLGGQRQHEGRRLRRLATRVPFLAAVSGNHDVDGLGHALWLKGAAAGEGRTHFRADGDHLLLSPMLTPVVHDAKEEVPSTDPALPGGLLVTCCPFWNYAGRGLTQHHWLRGRAEALWAQGRRLADAHRVDAWVVLHHEPPAGAAVAAGGWAEAPTGEDEGSTCARWVARFRPTAVVSGHLHRAPFLPGGRWVDRVGPGEPTPTGAGAEETSPLPGTWLFNPGRDPGEAGPRLVLLDLARHEACWLRWADGAELDRVPLVPDVNHAVAVGVSVPSAPSPTPEGPELSPGVRAFISQMVEALNTHQPGVPRGVNTGNCPQPEFSPRPLPSAGGAPSTTPGEPGDSGQG